MFPYKNLRRALAWHLVAGSTADTTSGRWRPVQPVLPPVWTDVFGRGSQILRHIEEPENTETSVRMPVGWKSCHLVAHISKIDSHAKLPDVACIFYFVLKVSYREGRCITILEYRNCVHLSKRLLGKSKPKRNVFG